MAGAGFLHTGVQPEAPGRKGQQGVLRYPQHSRLSSQFLGPQRMLTPLETRAKHIPHQPQAMAAGS